MNILQMIYLLHIIGNENKVYAAKAHLGYTEEDVDPQSATRSINNDWTENLMQATTI
jgi:hypothetical protein